MLNRIRIVSAPPFWGLLCPLGGIAMSSTVSVPVFDKKKHVLLIPDLFPIHMELLANVIRASGYRVEVLRTHGADVMEPA